MSRYIDANALGIGKADRNAFTIPEYADGWNSAIDIIENAPTADVVEVVRCKDCKHSSNMPLGLCYLHTEPYENSKGYKGDAVCVEPDDYCSYGERREENEG